LGDEETAKEAVNRGAQDYLLKTRLDSYSLTWALHSVIARKEVEDALFLEKERAQVTLNSIGDGLISTDISGNVTYLASSAETVGRFRFRKPAQRVIKGDFHGLVGAKTVRTSGHHTKFVVEALDGAVGYLSFSTKPVQQ
jgi:PAS domain-containing protein